MAPVEHALHNSNTQAILWFAGESSFVVLLASVVVQSIRKANRTLPPAVETRARQTKRRRDVAIFSVLAALSFGVLSYFGVYRRVLSYQVWAHENNEVPGALWTGWYASDPTTAKELQLGKWQDDINLGKEWTDIALGTTRGFWWSLAYFTGLTAWSIFLGIEARLKNIPWTTTMALILLASTVGLSFAQSLFAILLLLTPVPLASSHGVEPQRSPAWSPNPIAFAILSVTAVLASLLLPAFTQALPQHAFLPYAVCAYPLLFAILVQKTPVSWGKVHANTHSAKRSYAIVFSAISLVSTLLYSFMTVLALFENAPDARFHRYNYIWGTHSKYQRTPLQRSGAAIATILGVLNKHPVIGGVAWDVLLSAATLTVWASARDLDPKAILKSSVAPWLAVEDVPDEHGHQPVAVGGEGKPVPKLKPTTNAVDVPMASPSKRTRGRPAKHVDSTGSPTTATAVEAAGTLRRSTRRRRQTTEEEDDQSDYDPSAKTKALVNSVAHEEPVEESLREEAESSALGWGLFVLGGLGAVTSGVLGAEVTGR